MDLYLPAGLLGGGDPLVLGRGHGGVWQRRLGGCGGRGWGLELAGEHQGQRAAVAGHGGQGPRLQQGRDLLTVEYTIFKKVSDY